MIVIPKMMSLYLAFQVSELRDAVLLTVFLAGTQGTHRGQQSGNCLGKKNITVGIKDNTI